MTPPSCRSDGEGLGAAGPGPPGGGSERRPPGRSTPAGGAVGSPGSRRRSSPWRARPRSGGESSRSRSPARLRPRPREERRVRARTRRRRGSSRLRGAAPVQVPTRSRAAPPAAAPARPSDLPGATSVPPRRRGSADTGRRPPGQRGRSEGAAAARRGDPPQGWPRAPVPRVGRRLRGSSGVTKDDAEDRQRQREQAQARQPRSRSPPSPPRAGCARRLALPLDQASRGVAAGAPSRRPGAEQHGGDDQDPGGDHQPRTTRERGGPAAVNPAAVA